MSNQRYERVATDDGADSPTVAHAPNHTYPIPSSPPPSFRSRESSPNRRERERLIEDEDRDQTLADTFANDDSDDEDGDGLDDRQRLMRGNPSAAGNEGAGMGSSSEGEDVPSQGVVRRVTQLPAFVPGNDASSRRIYGGNDGVFANLSAKPQAGEDLEEKPPTYEQAAADATPPYWETTILAPGMVSDEVFVDGLPVGSVFSFVWNAMISMSFQIVGFLLTYLLHTTHAAKNGSKAGLGLTLIQIGFTWKTTSSSSGSSPNPGNDPNNYGGGPQDPNNHDFDPNQVGPDGGPIAAGLDAGLSTNDWLAYVLMIGGWFILIKSVSDFLRARRHEQLVLQSPDRGLPVPIVAEGERPEQAV